MSAAVRHAPPPGPPCRLLAFDTATERSCLAVVTPDALWTLEPDGGAKASATLIDDALALLAHAGANLQMLDAIAFGRGPGAFTGLRTSCAVAQGLAWGAGKPVLAVDSLLLVAESVREHALARGAGTVWVAQDARMEEIYAAAYRWQGERPGRWQVQVAPALYGVEAMNARWGETVPDGVAVVGSALPALGERLHGAPAIRLEPAAGSSRAEALGRLAVVALADGPRLDPADALPLYLRDKVALTTAERAAARSGA